MKWIISDADIPSFVKMLKSMAKIGNELHLETVNETHLKLQVINPSHSVQVGGGWRGGDPPPQPRLREWLPGRVGNDRKPYQMQ